MKRILLIAATLSFAATAFAQSYPNRAIKVVVPWPPGQATDLVARIVADKLSKSLGQPFVLDNRPGAGGTLGSDIAAKSAPDGYTLLAASSGPISIAPLLQSVPYDAEKAFAGVSLIAANSYLLVTRPSFPAANMKEFIALVKASPGKYTMGSSGTGATGHLIGELFNSQAGLKAVHVPYKGASPALTDIIGGQVDYIIETLQACIAHVKGGRLKAFGVSSAARNAALPDIPTISEAGGPPGFDIGAWIGYMAPAGTPREILERLSGEIRTALEAPDVRERYAALGIDPAASTPDQMVAYLKLQSARYGGVIKGANIKID